MLRLYEFKHINTYGLKDNCILPTLFGEAPKI